MDPPDHRHMRSLLNKAFTPRAIQSQTETVLELIDHYLGEVDPDHFDVVQDFSGPFPVEVITRMAGVPEEFRQQVRHWIDTSLHHEPGQIEISEDDMQANIDSGDVLLRPDPGAAREPAGRHDQQADRGRDPRRRRADPPARRHRDHRFRDPFGRCGRRDRHQADRQRGGRSSPGTPTSGRSCSTTGARSPAAVEELLRYEGPVQYNVRYTLKEARRPQWRDSRVQAGVPVRRRSEPRSARPSPTPTPSTSSATGPRHRTSASATAFTAALARRWPGWRADRAGTAARLHAALRGRLGRLQTGQHAERRGLRPCTREGASVRGRDDEEDRSRLGDSARATGSAWASSPRSSTSTTTTSCTSTRRSHAGERGGVREAVRQCPRQAIAIVGD